MGITVDPGLLRLCPKSLTPITKGTAFSASSANDLSAYTFSAQAFGTAAANRKIFLFFMSIPGGVTSSFSSATIGGVAATALVTKFDTGMNLVLLVADVPTGTTGDVVVNLSRVDNRAAIIGYPVYGASSTLLDSGESTSNPGSATLNTATGGLVLGGASAGSNWTTTWTNVTENVDATIGTVFTYSAGSDLVASGGTLSPQYEMIGGSPIGVFASLEPGA